MLKQFLFNKTSIPLAGKMLDAASMRVRAISSNIANAETPGYQRKEVEFEKELQKALTGHGVVGKRTHERHMNIGGAKFENVHPKTVIPDDPSTPNGINNVDVDREMVRLAENQLTYYTAARLMALRFESLRTAIRGRR